MASTPGVRGQGYLAAVPGLSSGVYTIDVDGAGAGQDPFEVYCDMVTDGGGWTLVLVSSDDGQSTWTMNNRGLMTTDTTTVGSLGAQNLDFKSPALHLVVFTDILFKHSPSGMTAAYAGVGGGTDSFAGFLSGIPYPVCDLGLADNGYPLTGGTLMTGSLLCDTDLYFNLGDHELGLAACNDLISATLRSTLVGLARRSVSTRV